jgi:hypothetical protein
VEPSAPTTVEGEASRGREGVERYFNEISDTWDKYELIAEEHRDLGQVVIVLSRFEARGKSSGVRVDSPLAVVFEFRDARCSRSRAFFSRGEALKAVGLEE